MRFLCYSVLGLLLLAAFPSCSENEGNACASDFDQEALFRNLADELILPAYADLNGKLNELEAKASAFVQAPSTGALADARNALRSAWISWQYAAHYEFGPAEEVFLRSSLNPFPVNVDDVEALVQNGGDNFDDPNTFDKGFPALDYLLAGVADSPEGVVAAFSTGSKAEGYGRYLLATLQDMQTRLERTLQKWNDGYREAFIGNTGTSAGSSLGLIVNGLNQNYEITKRDRIGIPSGALTIGLTNPEKVEARFLGSSGQLALEAVRATRKLYLGEGPGGTNGTGLDDYLNAIDARKGAQPLDGAILDQFNTVIGELSKVEDPLSTYVDAENVQIREAYAQASNLVVLLKTDLPSVLCVAITYVDNPSDSD